MSHKARRVAVLIETSHGFGRGLISGIACYIREHGPWTIYLEPRELEAPPPRWLKKWKGDGVIARLNDQKMLNVLTAIGAPVIDVRGRLKESKFPLVGGNNQKMAELAFHHLRNQGLQNFAFCGVPSGTNINRFLDQRRECFENLVHLAGCTCEIFEISGKESHSSDNWEQETERMANWLCQLPKPVGVMACDDYRGLQLLSACRLSRILVPDEVAVVGVNNDETICQLADPPLSSVDPGAENIGYRAAECLDRMMNGEPALQEPVFLDPVRLVPRRSSDAITIEDEDIVTALKFIRSHACAGITVEDVIHKVAISRSGLERKFKKWLGRTPKAEILRIKAAHVEQLLLESNLSLKEIALRSGFVSEKYLSDTIKRIFGVRPSFIRKRNERT